MGQRPIGLTGSGRDDEAALAVTDGEAHRDRPAHGQGSLHIIAAQTKQAVIMPMGWGQHLGLTVPGEPVADVQHPDGRPGDAQEQDL